MPDPYFLSTDVFSIPFRDNRFLIYAPKEGFLCEGNEALVDLIARLETANSEVFTEKEVELLDFFKKNNLLNVDKKRETAVSRMEEFAPDTVTLFTTNQCNLRCRYCYASAGEKKPLTIDWQYAKAAVDLIIRNATARKLNQINIGFHGGGEPLFPWSLIKRIVLYAESTAKQNHLKLSVYSATNGILREPQLDWIVKHFVNLNISFDGLPHVQDYHRPLCDGKGSFNVVDRTLKFLDLHGFQYGIRSTISDFSLGLMEESLNYILAHYKTKNIHFEPVFQCGRCKANDAYRVNLEQFASSFIRCREIARNAGVRLVYSGCRVEALSNSFCGIASDNFSVTPDGYITSCFEVTSSEDPKAKTFIYGRFNKQGELEIDESRRQHLHSFTVENFPYCANCFAKWHCSGDCVAKLGHGNYHGPRGHDRCVLNRMLVTDELGHYLQNSQ
jgi:uncharacterized protein